MTAHDRSKATASRLHSAWRWGPVAVASMLVAAAPTVHADPVFSTEPTAACVAAAATASPSLSGYAVLDCVSRSAQACMASPGGDTTIGMIDCLQGELGYWDRRLNAAYATRVAAARKQDAETPIRGAALPVEESLRRMQRAWISYRDAACLYEQSQWQGGTGGGPATASCQMTETARQALKLEGWWSQ